MHPQAAPDGRTAAELTALEHRLRDVYADAIASAAFGRPRPTVQTAERDLICLTAIAEQAPSVISVAQRHAILVPAAAGLGLYGHSAVIHDCAARIDAAFAVRSIPAPRLTDLLGDTPAPPHGSPISSESTATSESATPWSTAREDTQSAEDPPATTSPWGGTAPSASTAPSPVPPAPTSGHDASCDDDAEVAGGSVTNDFLNQLLANSTDEQDLTVWARQHVAAGHPLTAAAISAHLDVSTRTARRRLAALKDTDPDLFAPTPDEPLPVPARTHRAAHEPAPAPAPAPVAEVPSTSAVAATATALDLVGVHSRPAPTTQVHTDTVLAPSPTVASREHPLGATVLRPRQRPQPAVTVVISTAGTVTLSGTGTMGRQPIGPGTPVVVPDPNRLVSKTHLAYEVNHIGLTITDLSSANGTTIRHHDQLTTCTPGTPYLVGIGDRVDLGDQHFIRTQ